MRKLAESEGGDLAPGKLRKYVSEMFAIVRSVPCVVLEGWSDFRWPCCTCWRNPAADAKPISSFAEVAEVCACAIPAAYVMFMYKREICCITAIPMYRIRRYRYHPLIEYSALTA